MKKFLTVLLALSVVFTYSFSSVGAAFAATKDENLEKLNEAKVLAEKIVNTYAEDAVKAAVGEMKTAVDSVIADTFTENDYKAAWGAIDTKAALYKVIAEKYAEEAKKITDGNATEYTDAALYAANIFGISTKDTVGKELTASKITANVLVVLDAECEKTAYLNLYNAKKADLVSAYDKVDYSLYLDKVDPNDADGRTYLKEAQDKVAAGKKAVTESEIMTPNADVAAFSANEVAAGVNALNAQIAKDLVALVYEGTTYPTGLYKVVGVKTAKEVENQENQDAADLAALKAAIQKVYVNALNYNYPKADADAYVTVANYLAEKGFIKSAPGFNSGKTDWLGAVKAIEDLTAFAEKYKAEKDATGALVRDPAAVDAEVEKATNKTYADTAKVTIPTEKGQTIAEAEENIKAMSVKTDAADLAFAKKVANAAVEAAKSKVIDKFYALEAQKVEAKYAEIVAEIEAAKTVTKVNTAKAKIKDTVADIESAWNIKGKSKVDTANKAYAADDFTAVKAYIDYNNTGKTILDASYIDATDDQIYAALTKIYGEAGARTQAEVDALNVDGATVGATLPTVGTKAAMESAINALPASATEADKAAVEAAVKAIDAYKELGGTVSATLNTKVMNAVKQVKADMLKNLSIANAQLDKTDKAAVKDLLAKVEVAIDFANDMKDYDATVDMFNGLKATLTTALTKICAAELEAVEKAINAIPLNITLDDKTTIEAARKAYDAFVEEWTSYADPVFNAAAAVDNFRELALAEAALSILEKDAAIKATEGLKLSVSTKLYKKSNKIRVNWKVKDGDASYIDGYQVYKSTKAQKNYKFMGKTKKNYMDNKKNLKKGTRYFYKVRAYVEIDGQKYYSDWSNKGNRIYK